VVGAVHFQGGGKAKEKVPRYLGDRREDVPLWGNLCFSGGNCRHETLEGEDRRGAYTILCPNFVPFVCLFEPNMMILGQGSFLKAGIR